MPSTDVPDMQPSTVARRSCEYATIRGLTTENSNMTPSPGEQARTTATRMAAVRDEPRPVEASTVEASTLEASTVQLESSTELRNDRTTDIDTVPTLELLRLLNEQDARVAGAVAATLPVLAEVVDIAVSRLRAGGRVHYFGAGSSGRIGVLDAAEVVPTFGADPGTFVAHQAGGA